MSAADLPMMPFFVKDWIGATMHWPCAERGAYISFLSFQWINGCVPTDVSQLARIAGVSEKDFDHIWLTVGGKFDVNERGLFNKRLEEHRKEALRLRDARAFGASLANQKRRARRDTEHGAERNAGRDAEPHAERTHTSTSTSTSTSESKSAAPKRSARALRGELEVYDENWLSFKLAYPLRAGGQPWRAAMKTWRMRLAEGNDPQDIIAGTERYAAYIRARGDERTTFVMHAKTFLGSEKYFLQDWEIPPEAPESGRWLPPDEGAVDPP